MIKYRDNGSAVAYPKLLTDNNKSITSTFYRVATHSEVKKGLASQAKPIISVPATDYLNTPIEVVAGIKKACVYIGPTMETIRLRLTEAIVFRKIYKYNKSEDSIFSEDIEIELIEDGDEDDVSE